MKSGGKLRNELEGKAGERRKGATQNNPYGWREPGLLKLRTIDLALL